MAATGPGLFISLGLLCYNPLINGIRPSATTL